MTAATINEYSMMKGYRYGAESDTIVPIIGFLPQTVVLSIFAINAAGLRPSKDSNISVALLTVKILQLFR